MKGLKIKKSSGEMAEFSEEKIRFSLQRAGASEDQIESIIKEITAELYEGISTGQIYKRAFALLKARSRSLAARYHLKQAIMELGPSGFPFEKYVAEILNVQGFITKVRQLIKGKCVAHEIDVIARKDDDIFVVECKYHNQRGIFCDVKVPLYIQSRFKDVEGTLIRSNGQSHKKSQGWVVTNTRFSIEALQYGNCIGLKLLSWDYPLNNGLREQIDALCLYPVTCLTSLSKTEKQRLLEKNIVLCKELMNGQPILKSLGIKQDRIYTILKETNQLCCN